MSAQATGLRPGIVVLTGAGISRESGLATFRDEDGVWRKVRLEDVATPQAYWRDPETVLAFYDARRRSLLDPAVQPNAAHRALARLEQEWPGEFLLVTQNVDDLHERAGSRRLLHMHGELLRAWCLTCHATHGGWRENITRETSCPACGSTGRMRPHIVWFGEMPLHMEAIEAALDRCGMFISIGTSGNVYPAAGFVEQVRGRAETVELNLEPSEGAYFFDRAIHGPATEVVPAFVDELLARR